MKSGYYWIRVIGETRDTIGYFMNDTEMWITTFRGCIENDMVDVIRPVQ